MNHAQNQSKKFKAKSLSRKAKRQAKENAAFEAETERLVAEILNSRHEEQRPKETSRA